MILDHDYVKMVLDGFSGLLDHGTGNLSLTGLVIYLFFREGIPFYKRQRNKRNGNPGDDGMAERLLACEKSLGKVKDFTSRADERWKSQAKFNDRMEEHVKVLHAKIDKLAGVGR